MIVKDKMCVSIIKCVLEVRSLMAHIIIHEIVMSTIMTLFVIDCGIFQNLDIEIAYHFPKNV